jgi:CBS-domain-containing membrane protein
VFWSWLGAFLGITPVVFLNYNLFSGSDFVYIIGSFGTSVVLIYGAVRSPLVQPRNLIGGHLPSAFVGVACWQPFQLQRPWP